MSLLLVALFAVALVLLLLVRVSERWLSLLLALVTFGLALLLLVMNVQVSGAGFGSLGRMQGLLSVGGALLGGSVISLLRHHARTGAAGQFRPAGDDDAILRRYHVQPLALIAPNLKKDACAARAAGR